MKNVSMFVFCIGLALSMIVSCTGAPAEAEIRGAAAPEIEMSFNEVEGKEWLLSELRIAGRTVQIDRQKLEMDNMRDFFSITFQEGRVSGVAAPNLYHGPYTIGSGKVLNIGLLASTLMAAFFELEELKEHEYYAYLSRVTRWNLLGGKLELYSTTNDGAELVLAFTQK